MDFVVNSASCAVRNARISLVMASNVIHCSLIERDGKANEAIHRHAPLLADLEADSATTVARQPRIFCSQPLELCVQVVVHRRPPWGAPPSESSHAASRRSVWRDCIRDEGARPIQYRRVVAVDSHTDVSIGRPRTVPLDTQRGDAGHDGRGGAPAATGGAATCGRPASSVTGREPPSPSQSRHSGSVASSWRRHRRYQRLRLGRRIFPGVIRAIDQSAFACTRNPNGRFPEETAWRLSHPPPITVPSVSSARLAG